MTTVGDGWTGGDRTKVSERALSTALFDLILNVPDSRELPSAHPHERAAEIGKSAALRAATISGALALPPGPLGLFTLIPDLVSIWKVQQQMVVDIAATFGCQAQLRREVMVYCLFKHGGAALLRDLVARVGERVVVREASLRLLQQMLQKVGLRVSQKLIGRGVARWIPVVGALGTGAYAFYDTKQVAATAAAYFSQPLESEPPPLPSDPVSS